jgi:hypothetical protein
MGHLDSAWRQSKPGQPLRPGLTLIILVVLLAHVVMAWFAAGLVTGWSNPPAPERVLYAQMVPPKPLVPPKPPRPAPSVEPMAVKPPPSPTPPPAPPPARAVVPQPGQSVAPAGAALGGLERAEGLRLSRPADLMPNQGVMPMQAYWGRYDQGGQLLGEGEVVMAYPTPAQYQVSLSARALGWLSLLVSGEVSIKSEGILTPSGLSPLRFEQNTPRRGRVESRFDPAARSAVLRPNQPALPLPAGTQDRLSVVFQIAWLGESQPGGLRPGQRFDLPMATLSEVRNLTFHAGDPEELVFPGGLLLPTIKVVSDPFEFRRIGQIQIWLDQADRHMPARILYTEPDGRALDFLAIRATQ